MDIDGDLINIVFVVVILYFILLPEYFVKTHLTSNPVNKYLSSDFFYDTGLYLIQKTRSVTFLNSNGTNM